MVTELGVRLALDWGAARIGVAACDPGGVLAYPVETIANTPQALRRITELTSEYDPVEIVMGLPIDLRGREAQAATAVRARAQEVANAIQLPVRLVDERFTTAQAAKQLRETGKTARRSRGVIDQAAAVALLRQLIDPANNVSGEVVLPCPANVTESLPEGATQ